MSAIPDNPMRDMRLETRLSRLLTASTMAAGAVTAIGLAAFLWQHPGEPATYKPFTPSDLSDFGSLLGRARVLEARAIMQCGVLLLVLTPVARVAATLIAFLARRDWLYVAVTLVVLGTLAAGLAGVNL